MIEALEMWIEKKENEQDKEDYAKIEKEAENNRKIEENQYKEPIANN